MGSLYKPTLGHGELRSDRLWTPSHEQQEEDRKLHNN